MYRPYVANSPSFKALSNHNPKTSKLGIIKMSKLRNYELSKHKRGPKTCIQLKVVNNMKISKLFYNLT